MNGNYHIVKPADHDGWLAERMKGIGSSDAGTLMGISPFSTPLKLWRQRMGIDPPTPESESMRNGHYLEPAVAEYFAGATGSVIDYSSEGDWMAVNNEKDYLRVSPDRLFWPEGAEHRMDNRLILEIKSTSKYVDPDSLPLYWVCQVQYQMGVMGVPIAAIAWITSNPRLQMGHTWIRFNPAFFKKLTEVIDKFWNENIIKRIEPEPITEEDMMLKWPTSVTDRNVTAEPADVNNCREYLRLTKEKEDLEVQLSAVTALIKKKIGDGEFLVSPDPETGHPVTIARFKSVNETVFDEKRFENEQPEEYLKYLRKHFDKNLFKEEDKENWKKYTTQQKGARRFAVILKE